MNDKYVNTLGDWRVYWPQQPWRVHLHSHSLQCLATAASSPSPMYDLYVCIIYTLVYGQSGIDSPKLCHSTKLSMKIENLTTKRLPPISCVEYSGTLPNDT
jgi:hypothetical protein